MPLRKRGHLFYGICTRRGAEARHAVSVCLGELIPDDHVCRVIDAFVDRLDMADWGFERAEAADTGRPGYDPRDLLKLYLYGYLQQIRSSRRLESECRRNIELMWLLGRLAPDHKAIAEFRRLHRDGVTAAGAELVRLARSVGLVKGEWIAIDGSKFQAVSSARGVREREALERYLKLRCTTSSQRLVSRHLHEEALQRMQQRATPEAMRLRRSTVEHPFANLKYRIFGHPRFLLRGLRGAQTEISLAVAAYNLKRMRNILGGHQLASALRTV